MADETTQHSLEVNLERLARDMKTLLGLVSKAVNYVAEAQSEVPERVRRFVTYMHDIHDITYMYEERGIPVPDYLLREMERCDDRYRQIFHELHTDNGAFERIRREMAKDPKNRWDHTRLLTKPQEQSNEARQSKQQRTGEQEDGADAAGGEPSGG